MSELKLAISPGGSKHEYLAEMLEKEGYSVKICEEESAKNISFFITPRSKCPEVLKAHGVAPFEYLKDDSFKRENGVLTAEAALCVAEPYFDSAFSDGKVLITGSGCIAYPLAKMLILAGADVTVAARNQSKLAQFSALGAKTDTLPITKGGYDIVFNTVPSEIFDAQALAIIKSAKIIDLASTPCTKEPCENLVRALALPGQYMPKSAAKIIYRSFLSYVKKVSL